MAETNVPPPQTMPPQQPTIKSDPGQNPGGSSLQWLQFNIAYFLGPPGFLKLVQVLFGIICMACASPARMNGTHWFLFVAVTAFIATLVWVFLYLLSIREALKLPIDWTLTVSLATNLKYLNLKKKYILCFWRKFSFLLYFRIIFLF